MTKLQISPLVESIRDEVIDWRRYLHKNPELSFQEEKTSQFVYDTLLTFENLEVTRPTEYSVMARLIGNQPGKVLGIRADMDALPIQEENTFEFVSQNPGVMHACGHDGHTAMLLGAAKLLSGMKDKIKGEVRFFFQHAEEYLPGGAQEMVDAGVMDGVDIVIGAHLLANLEVGKIGVIYGPTTASPDEIKITIKGKGGHGAMPHDTIDSIAIGAQVVTNLQHIVSRNTNPLDSHVVTIGSFIGGEASNVIANSVEITGSIRSFGGAVREAAPMLIERIVKGVTEAHGADYDFEYIHGYRPVITDNEVTRVLEETIRETIGEDAISILGPTMTGEDFSAFLQKAPGTFFMVGAGNKEKGIVYPHHHPKFTVDEDSLEYGVNIFVNAVFKYLV